eukprot:TRINITY_DN1287_c0_g2_i1.p1 TRINITY_DN1287_c0_g2~~TRINITY_DN1287_c0_g2_i1.p1  ORF type:complete len:447 (+),score=207.12 TRINITY_DN1287_c0_g2_i1:33-1343(+)
MSEHLFVKKHFGKPTWCAFCEKFIWGLGKQGYQCTVCSYPVHPKCKDKALSGERCPGVKTKYAKKGDDPSAEAHEAAHAGARKPKNAGNASSAVPYPEDESSDDEEEEAPAKQPPRPLLSQPSLQRIGDGKKEEVATCIEDLYEIGEELGRGAFSVVKKCRHKVSGEQFAVKVITKKNVQQDLHRLAIEMKVLRMVDHPNIIQLKEVFETDEILYIITEVVTGGELFDRIVSKGSYSERDASILIRKLVEALDYLHDRDIVHRDLKPENLLLKTKESDTDVKLADFGLSKIMGNSVMLQTACGTPGYVAPEILLSRGYGREVDMWSVGVITYILLCGFPPFYNDNIPYLFESIMKADFDYPSEYWGHISDDAIDLIDSLLVVDPNQRLSSKKALNHPWLQGTAPETPLNNVGARLATTMTSYRDSVANMGPTNADD